MARGAGVMARTQRGAFAGAEGKGKGARGRPAGKAAAAAGKAGGGAAAAPELLWDRRAMTRLLNAVRAESFGDVRRRRAQTAAAVKFVHRGPEMRSKRTF